MLESTEYRNALNVVYAARAIFAALRPASAMDAFFYIHQKEPWLGENTVEPGHTGRVSPLREHQGEVMESRKRITMQPEKQQSNKRIEHHHLWLTRSGVFPLGSGNRNF